MSKKLEVSELDFDNIKENLKNYLKNQNEFTDYSFEGSAINVLLNILAYNTNMNAVHTNFAFAETFLDSAVKRGSVVSRAKELGYLPRSKTSARALVTLSFNVTGNPLQYTIPKNTKFIASLNSKTYTFQTASDLLFNNSGNVFTRSIEIFEGNRTTYSYTVDLSNLNQRFIIPSKDVDLTSLSVVVKDNNTATSLSYEYSNMKDLNIGQLTPTTTVYFLQETYDGFYEVYFGDGVIGKALENGNIVELTYNISSGAAANGISSFTLQYPLSVNNLSIVTVEPSYGGNERESVESIKYLAPFYYQSQGRAVTEDDYKSIIKNIYPNIDDVAVWGGEKNEPPFYGKVFLAIKPKANQYFSNTVKQKIQNDFISKYNIVSVRPEIVDPDYIYVTVNTTVSYNARLYNNNTNSNLENLIRTNIENFFADESNKFGKSLYFSKLQQVIDGTNQVILSTNTNLYLEKEKPIFSGISGQYSFKFNNSIEPGSLSSNEFQIGNDTWKFVDIPDTSTGVPYVTGKIAVYRVVGNEKVYLTQNTGTINYNTGEVLITNFKIDNIPSDPILKRLKVSIAQGNFANRTTPNQVYTDYNVYTNGRDQIIVLKPNSIFITLIPDESTV